MGNYLACGAPVRVSAAGGKACSLVRLIHADGTVEDLTPPVTVAELMLENPLHFVCHANQENPTCQQHRPLPADAELETGEVYYLLSKSMSSARGINNRSPVRQQLQKPSELKSNSSGKKDWSLLQAFRMRQKGSVTQVTVSAEFVAQLLEQQQQQQQAASSSSSKGSSCVAEEDDESNPELQMAYQMRLMSRSTSWRPRLATIEESSF